MSDTTKTQNRYHQLIEKIFFNGYTKDTTEIPFERSALKEVAKELGIVLPDNLGDVIYAMRFRVPMPAKVLATQTKGREWIIELVGRAKYRFRLAKENRIVPNPNLAVIRIPDSTPEIIAAYALDDEQALLAKVRYNRLASIVDRQVPASMDGLGSASNPMSDATAIDVQEIAARVQAQPRNARGPRPLGGNAQVDPPWTEINRIELSIRPGQMARCSGSALDAVVGLVRAQARCDIQSDVVPHVGPPRLHLRHGSQNPRIGASDDVGAHVTQQIARRGVALLCEGVKEERLPLARHPERCRHSRPRRCRHDGLNGTS